LTEIAALPFPVVCKPRFGAGSQATFLLRRAHDLSGARDRATAEGWSGELLLQPFVPGQAASVASLIGPRGRLSLLPAEQRLSDDGRFHYLGGRLPLADALAERARRLADRALAAVPGLQGYVGVDVALGADASEDQVIEINPRLTTSYIGLRKLARSNLAAAMLDVILGREPVELAWEAGSISFAADGHA
jgi:predicted ATP-grasp superfamily ATP-dependent carboligase